MFFSTVIKDKLLKLSVRIEMNFKDLLFNLLCQCSLFVDFFSIISFNRFLIDNVINNYLILESCVPQDVPQ